MAFRASNVIPQIAYQKVRGAASQLKLNCAAFIAQMAASGAGYSFLRDIYLTLHNANAQFTLLAGTPGLAEYATAQEHDENYDVAAEFVAMQAAITAALSWMNTNIPTTVTATAPADWPINQSMISTSFNAGDTAGFRVLLQTVADSVS